MDTRRVYWQILFSLCGISATLGLGQEALTPEDAHIIPLTYYVCEGTETDTKLTIDIHKLNEDLVVDIELVIPEDLTDLYQVHVIVEKWEQDTWKVTNYTSTGKVCEMANKYFQTGWKKIRDNVTPALPGDCTIPAGHYKITDLEIFRNEVTLPVTEYGKFRIVNRIENELDEEVNCHCIELEIVP